MTDNIFEYISQQQRIDELERKNKSLAAQLSTIRRKYDDLKLTNINRHKARRLERATPAMLKYIAGDKSMRIADIANKYKIPIPTVKNNIYKLRKNK